MNPGLLKAVEGPFASLTPDKMLTLISLIRWVAKRWHPDPLTHVPNAAAPPRHDNSNVNCYAALLLYSLTFLEVDLQGVSVHSRGISTGDGEKGATLESKLCLRAFEKGFAKEMPQPPSAPNQVFIRNKTESNDLVAGRGDGGIRCRGGNASRCAGLCVRLGGRP